MLCFYPIAVSLEVETGLSFVGLVGVIDPPRKECKQAIADCRVAGISVIMITGDRFDSSSFLCPSPITMRQKGLF